MQNIEDDFRTIPVGPLGLVPLKSCSSMGTQINDWIARWRKERNKDFHELLSFSGYIKDNYIIPASTPRFGSGEAKGTIESSVRGYDVYILVDVLNHSLTYSLCGMVNHMSPDDHFADLKRVIAAIGGKATRVNVIMPFLYESRQHKRNGRESLDCAMALQELVRMGVNSIITFDAHDARVQNAIPLHSFENVPCIYQFVKAIVRVMPDIEFDKDKLMIISPDEGGTSRAIYYANHLGVDMGMFYKRRDYTKIIDGKNPIIAHEFLGSDVTGQDVIIVDDMISSGDSMLEVARELKRRKARRVICVSTFGLFTNGLAKFDSAYEDGVFDFLLTTNLTYQSPELLSRKYYVSVDMNKYIAMIIDHLNHNISLHSLLNPTKRINNLLERHLKEKQ
ncbi:MAG: ribose-phosphate pyrophosphokinase [Lachnospiraceae bacterium]|jgi:ribose-phosphate pyrophosphokinase|nr:ribose-phosphate pyrophosphokinase [Lachnospiraceae bacterium]